MLQKNLNFLCLSDFIFRVITKYKYKRRGLEIKLNKNEIVTVGIVYYGFGLKGATYIGS